MTSINVSGIDDVTGQSLTYSGTESINGTVPPSRTISAGTGLTGGGNLSGNIIISLANTSVSPNSYTYGSFTVDQQGRLTAASSGAPPDSVLLSTTPGIDMKTAGNTTLYSVPASTSVFITKIIVVLTAASGTVTAGSISVGNTATANEIIGTTALTGLTVINKAWTILVEGLSAVALATEDVVLKVQNAFGGTTVTATAYLFGMKF